MVLLGKRKIHSISALSYKGSATSTGSLLSAADKDEKLKERNPGE
jgi:hypothetical protein